MLPKGYKHSPEARLKISKAKTGEKNSFYGKHHSEETKKKIGLWSKGRPSILKGKKLSEETRRKISLAHKGLNNWSKGKKRGMFSLEHRLKMSLAQRGERGSNWKGGITLLMNTIRHSLKYRLWRSDIYVIDDYTCQMCGARGGKLNVDHYPKRFSDIFHDNNIKTLEQALECEEFWNLNNGRTLCEPCHRITDTWGRPKKN